MAGKVRMPGYTNLCQKWMDLFIHSFSQLKKNNLKNAFSSVLLAFLLYPLSWYHSIVLQQKFWTESSHHWSARERTSIAVYCSCTDTTNISHCHTSNVMTGN